MKLFNIYFVLLYFVLCITYTLEYGVGYDPYKNGHQPLTFRKDFHQIARYFDAVRTTETLIHGKNIGPYIRDAGLKATLGINFHQPLEPQIKAVISNALDKKNYVHAIMVGNEDIRRVGAYRIRDVVRRIKTELAKKGRQNILVGTAQGTVELLSRNIPGLKELAKECTAIGANIYSYFSRHDDLIKTLTLQYRWIQQRFPGVRIMITETGWPSDGEKPNAYGNHASHWHQQEFLRRFNCDWFKPGMPGFKRPTDMYIFQFFDTEYKLQQGQPLREGHFGLVKSNGKVKHSSFMPKPNKPHHQHRPHH